MGIVAELGLQAAEAAMDMADVTAVVLCAVGLVVLAVWLWRFDGPYALAGAKARRHCLPAMIPFLVFFLWLVFMAMAFELAERIDDPDRQTIARNAMMLVLNVWMIGVILVLARRYFVRQFKGFGLNPKTLAKDAGWATVNLTAIYPLVIGGIGLVYLIGRLVRGEDFAIQTHQSLEELLAFEQFWSQALMVVLVVGVVPVFEELLFRGLMQSSLRGVLPGVWPAILVTSALFAAVHYSTHALSIFALSCCMGYAYERSGSLFRPILIHAMFNGVSVATAMTQ